MLAFDSRNSIENRSQPSRASGCKRMLHDEKRLQWTNVIPKLHPGMRSKVEPIRQGNDVPVVLVVEDDEGVRRLLSRALEEAGCRVLQAGSAAEARQRLEEETPQAILLDFYLPDALGRALIPEFLEAAPGAGVIVITGSRDVADAVQSLKLGARDYLLKDSSFLENVRLVVRRTLDELETERKLCATEESLRHQMERQKAVADFGVRALALTDEQTLFDEATRLIVSVVGVELAKVQELVDDGRHLLLCSGVGWRPNEMGKNLITAGPETPAGLALHSSRPVIVQNLSEDPRFTPPRLLTDHGVLSGVTVLIHGPDGPFGVLGMHSATCREFGEVDVDFLQAIANILAAALWRIKAEEGLRKRKKFCSMITGTMDALLVVLDRDGQIIGFNRACEELTGYTDNEVAGKAVWDFLIPESERDTVREVGERLMGGETQNCFDNHWVTRQGDLRWISWSNSVLKSTDDQIEAIIATGIDTTERRTLEQELLNAAEQEQQRLGRDLHDDLCQYLGAIRMMMERMGSSLGNLGLKEYKDQAEKINGHLREATERTRLLAHGLAPFQSKEGGMAKAFAELALYVEKVAGARCRCSIPSDADLRDSQTATQLFRIAQEAVQNAVRHGNASEINLSLRRLTDGTRVFKVSDNGSGFSSRSSGGTGIRNMEQRARVIGGELDVASEPGRGTVVTCFIPASIA